MTPASPHEIDWKYAFGVLADILNESETGSAALIELGLHLPEAWLEQIDGLLDLRQEWVLNRNAADSNPRTPPQPL